MEYFFFNCNLAEILGSVRKENTIDNEQFIQLILRELFAIQFNPMNEQKAFFKAKLFLVTWSGVAK